MNLINILTIASESNNFIELGKNDFFTYFSGTAKAILITGFIATVLVKSLFKNQGSMVDVLKTNKNRIVELLVALVAIVGLDLNTNLFLNEEYIAEENENEKVVIGVDKDEKLTKVQITAHRGATKEYPENTMAAFVGAKEIGADWIEVDVQQTKDKKLVIMHDLNIIRVSGINKTIKEMTYDELKNIDIGSYKGTKYSNQRIPLFEDVVKWAKENNIKLNIEIKSFGQEENFINDIVKVIKENDYIGECAVASFGYNHLEEIKVYDPSIETILLVGQATDETLALKDADIFSIDISGVNKELVDKVHEQGQKIYVWTVNDAESINRMIDLDVDNIITDDLMLANNVVKKKEVDSVIDEFMSESTEEEKDTSRDENKSQEENDTVKRD